MSVESASPLIRIAVLPFTEIDGASDKILGFGLADSLIAMLSRVKTFAVRPTSSVLKYEDRGKTALEAGEELGVDYIVAGHIHEIGERLWVRVQLLDVARRTALWAQTFEEAAGIFRVQDEIPGQVANMLARRLSSGERVLTRRGTDSAEAYLCYVRGRYCLNKFTLGREAIDHFARAIDFDPGYAPAYVGLADAYYISDPAANPRDAVPKARAALLKALDLDPELPEGWLYLAILRFWEDWDRAGAEPDYRRALELNPNCPNARATYAWLLTALGRFAEAETEMRRALELDPLSPAASTNLALPAYFGRDYETAIARLEKLHFEPYFWTRDALLGQAYAGAGRFAEAQAMFQCVIERTGGLVPEASAELSRVLALAGETDRAQSTARAVAGPCAYYLAGAYTALGDQAAAFEWLETACREHDKWTAWLQVDPALDSLRSDSRWPEIVRKCGF